MKKINEEDYRDFTLITPSFKLTGSFRTVKDAYFCYSGTARVIGTLKDGTEKLVFIK